MKSLKLLLLLLISAGTVSAQGVKFSNDKPESGDEIKFTYDPTGTKLDKLADIKCSVLAFSNTTIPKITQIDLIKAGEIYNGKFSTSDSVSLVGLTFSVGNQKDEMPNGYLLGFTKKNKVQVETYLTKGFLYGLAGNFYLGLKLDAAKAADFYKQAFDLNPNLKSKYLRDYLSASLKADKVKGTILINEKINEVSQQGNSTKETDFMLLINLYSLLKQQTKIDSVKRILLQRYPTGSYAFSMDYEALNKERNALLAEYKAKSIIATYNLDSTKKADKAKLSGINYSLARVFALSEDTSKFENYAAKIEGKKSRADIYNFAAWPLAEKNKNSVFAAKISKQSLDLINEAKNEAVPSSFSSKIDYIKALDRDYARHADTYALILHNLGNDKEAAIYQEKAGKFSDAAGNERYVMYLDLAGEKEKAFAKADSSMRADKYTTALKSRLKDLYISLKKGNDVDGYVAGIEKIIAEKQMAELTKKMINIPASAFALKNLKGETVSLESLKGKIVILDFWATWCGPCVASFPGMQKAMAKYSNNPNVVFLFVNTLQREENREKVVTDFVEQKKLNFNVVYDTKNIKDPSQFDLVNAYKVEGIPTKFIIDGDGNIRFKSVGFSGSDEGVVKEIDAMIGLLSIKGVSNGK